MERRKFGDEIKNLIGNLTRKKDLLNELKPRDIAVDRRLMLLLRYEVVVAAVTQQTFTPP